MLHSNNSLEVWIDDESSYAGLSYRVKALLDNPFENGKNN